jgi:hypothetical protein
MKLNKIAKIIALATSLSCLPVKATVEIPESTLNKDIPSVYTVKRGDTLWDISEMFFKDPWKWTYLWEKNDDIENPHLIYPDDKIMLVNMDGGKKGLKIERAKKPQKKVLVVTPTKQYLELNKPIDAINFSKLEKISQKIIIEQMEVIDTFQSIISSEEDHLMLNKGDNIFTTGVAYKAKYSEVDSIYTLDSPIYIDEIYKGHKLIKIGEAKLISTNTEEEISKYVIKSQRQPISQNDYILREESLRNKILSISVPKYEVNTRVIQIVGGVNNGGTWDTIVLDAGKDKNLVAGNVLALNKKGKTIINPKNQKEINLPFKEYGSILIFDVQKDISLGLVYENKKSVIVNDIAKNPKGGL